MKDIIEEPTAPAAQVQNLRVDPESDGQRLDNYLLRHLKGAPKTLIYRIIRSGEVRLNKGRASADTRVQAGDMVRVPPLRLSAPKADGGHAPAREFPILWEDDALLGIDKPAGVAVHGGSGVSFGVIEQLRQARPGARMLELVHRLDRDTSGVLLVAKKRSALKHVQDQFRERETGKTYLAVACAAEALRDLDAHGPEREQLVDERTWNLLVLVHLPHVRRHLRGGELRDRRLEQAFVVGEHRRLTSGASDDEAMASPVVTVVDAAMLKVKVFPAVLSL